LDSLKSCAEASELIVPAVWGEQTAYRGFTKEVIKLDLPPLVTVTKVSQQDLIANSRSFDLVKEEILFPMYASIAARITKATGVLDNTRIDPWTSKQDVENYSNIYGHQLAVARVADVIANLFSCVNLDLNRDNVEKISYMAFLHDANKIIEIQEKNAINNGVLDGHKASRYIQQTEQILKNAKIPQEHIDLAEIACFATSSYGIRMFIKVFNGKIQIREPSLAEMIIRIADDMTCSRNGHHMLMTPIERFIAAGNLVEGAKFENFAPTALYEDGKIVFNIDSQECFEPRVIGQALAFHIECAQTILTELCKKLLPHYPNDLDLSKPAESMKRLILKFLG
jgi:hypothetical protein